MAISGDHALVGKNGIGRLDQVAAEILSSDAYFSSRGNGTDTGYVAALYDDLVRRTPREEELQFFLSRLASGSTRFQLVSMIASGSEAVARSGAEGSSAFAFSADRTAPGRSKPNCAPVTDSNVTNFLYFRSSQQRYCDSSARVTCSEMAKRWCGALERPRLPRRSRSTQRPPPSTFPRPP